MFIILDGIDGSGKSTIMSTWAELLSSQGKKIFSLKSYWQEYHTHPTAEDLGGYDVILSAEPTSVWVGAAIRQEMIRHKYQYGARSIAAAYAIDRLILYKRILVPLIVDGKLVIQDRGVSTSLCYQPLQDTSISMRDVAALEGNTYALDHAPHHLVIADLPAERAIERLHGRDEKQDNALFEQKNFLGKARKQFLHADYQKFFISRTTRIHTLNTDVPVDIMKRDAIQLLLTINPTHS